MRLPLNDLLEKCRGNAPRRIAVAAAEDEAVLQSLSMAYREGIAQPVLCGDIERIDQIARQHNININAFEIVETEHPQQAASIAVSLVKSGRADCLMKGLLQTADLLRAVLHKEQGLHRESEILSHVALLDGPQLDRTVLITDGAFVTCPDLKTKVQMIDNAVRLAHRIGIECPLVAPIAALELVNPAMPATLDAAALTVMNRRGQIPGCVVDGPLALDGALSPEAARRKGIESPAAGKADILLFHNIEAANSTSKALTACGCVLGGVVVGAQAPLILTSRSDSPDSKLYSIALACAIC